MAHRAKKSLGQHFLNDLWLAERIVSALRESKPKRVLEVGPGQGVLTQFLLKGDYHFKAIEIDDTLQAYLIKKFPEFKGNLVHFDFLKARLDRFFDGEEFSVIGNFPYNISSQIIFKILQYKTLVPELIGMFQKEVAERIVAGPGSKIYGVTSVLTQAFYTGELLFHVPPSSFDPPPKVDSAVIRLRRKAELTLDCDEVLFKNIVKTAFRQRRKMMRNTLKIFMRPGTELGEDVLTNRPEQLSVQDFIDITKKIDTDEFRAKDHE